MLNRKVVGDFLKEKLEEKIPKDIVFSELVETFCLYVEDDFYEWLKDNFYSFYGSELVFWNNVRGRIEQKRKEGIFKKEKKLTDIQREELLNILAENDVETMEWYKNQVLYDICLNGLVGFVNMSDEELIYAYRDYADGQEIPNNKRIVL